MCEQILRKKQLKISFQLTVQSDSVHHYQKSRQEEQETAGHLVPIVRKQTEKNAGAQTSIDIARGVSMVTVNPIKLTMKD